MGFYEELLALEKTEGEVPTSVLVPQPDSQGGFYEELLRLGEQPKFPQVTSPATSPHATDPSGLGRSGLFGLPIPPSQQEEVAVQQYSNPNTIVKEKAEKLILDQAEFDPEGSGYDYKSARRAGIKPDETGHWPSRVPDTGLLLKGRGHETFQKTIAGEKQAGYEIVKGEDGRYYSIPSNERKSLQEEERKYYEEHPQSTLQLSPTEWTSPFGMPIYRDQHNQLHSESSATVPTSGGKFMTIPVIWPDSQTGEARYFTEDEARRLIETNNYVNPVSGEKIKLFDSEPEATEYAIDRDLILRDPKHPWNQPELLQTREQKAREREGEFSIKRALDFTGVNLGIGLNQLKKGFGGLVDYLGADWAGDYLKKSADERIKELEGMFTQADLKEVKKPLFVDDPEGLFRIKINPNGTMRGYWGKIVQQTPNMAASIGTGAGFAKVGFALGKKALGKKVSEKVLTKGSGALGFGAGEGAIELGFAKAEVEDAIKQAPLKLLKTSPRFQEIYNDLISKEFSKGDAEREARLLLADELSQGAATKVGITTGLIGAPFGAWLASVFKYKPDSVFKRAMVGLFGEAGQEFAQTGVGGVIKEVAKGDAGLPMKKPMELYKESLEGGATGGPTGMGVGAVAGAGKTDAQRVGEALNEMVEGSEFVEGEALKQATEVSSPVDAEITLRKSPEAIPQEPLKTDEELRQIRRDRKAEEAKEQKKKNITEASQKFKQKSKTAKGRAEAKEKKAGREGVEEDVLEVPSNIADEFRTDDEIREDFQRLDDEAKQAREAGKPISEQAEIVIQREKVRIEGKENRVRNLESEGKLNKARRAKEKIKEINKKIEKLEERKKLAKNKEAREAYKEEQRLERLTRPDVEEVPVQEEVVEEPKVEEVEEAPKVEVPEEPIAEAKVEEPPKKTKADEIQEEIDKVKQETKDKKELLEAVRDYPTLESLSNTQSDRYQESTGSVFKKNTKLKLNNRRASKKFLVDLAKRFKIRYSGHQGVLSNEEIAKNISDHILNKYEIKLKNVGVETKRKVGKDNLRSQMGGKTGFSVDIDEVKAFYGKGFAENLFKSGVGLLAKKGGKRKVLSLDQFAEVLEQGGYVAIDEATGKIDPRQVEEVLERLGHGDPVENLGEITEFEQSEEDLTEEHISGLEKQRDEELSLPEEEYEELELKAEYGELTEAEQEKFGKASDARARLSGDDEIMFFMGSGAVVNAAKKLMKGYSKGANKLYSYLDKKFSPLSALGDLPDQGKFLRLREKLGGRLQTVDKIARDVYKAFNTAPEEDKPAILEFLTNKDASATMIVDPEARSVAVRVKKTFQAAGKQFVARGLLSQEAFENYSGAYLPRLYMAHLIKGDLDSKGMITLPNGKKTSNFGFLKPRKDIPEEIRDTILGEIKNSGFLAAKGLHTELRDIAILDTLEKIATNPDWVLPESVAMWPVKKDGELAKNATPWSVFFLKAKANDLRIEASRLNKEAESMANNDLLTELEKKELNKIKKRAERLSETAERMEQAVEEAEPGMQQISLEGLPAEAIKRLGKKASAAEIKREANRLREQAEQEEFEGDRGGRMIELADRLDALVDPILKPRNAKDYKTVPDNKRYGALRGVQLHKEIYEDFVDTMESTSNILETAEKVQQIWKLSKVALNPPTQFRNFASNMILLNLSGISIPRLIKHFHSGVMRTDQWEKAWKVAQRGGIGKSTFSSQEMNLLQEEFLRIEKQDVGQLGKLWLMMEAFTKKGIRGASNLYGSIEAFGKTMKIMDEMEKGKSTEEAIREANKWLFDYSLVPKKVRELRRLPVGVPFLTFYYKAFPRMVETLIKAPWRFTPYIALTMAMASLFQGANDVDDEDYEKLIKYALPDYLKDKPGVVPLPSKDANGKWQFLDISYLYPWSQYAQFYNVMTNPDDQVLDKLTNTMGLFGGPLPSYVTGLTTGVDPFTNKKIVREGSLPSEKVSQTLAWMYNVMAPPWLNFGAEGSPQQFKGVLQKMMEAWKGENVNPYTGEPKQTFKQATARLFGLNVYPIDYRQSVSFNLRRIEGEIKDARKNALRIMRDPNLSKEQKEISKKQYKEYLRQLVQEKKDYLKDATLSRKAKRKLFSKRKR